MRRGFVVAALAAAIAVGAVVVTSSSAGGGGHAPYRFYVGPIFVDQSSLPRVFVEDVSGKQRTVKAFFRTNAVPDPDPVPVAIPAGGTDSGNGPTCGAASCEVRVEVRSRSPLIAPVLRYQDPDGIAQEKLAGDFIVVRDGKRVW